MTESAPAAAGSGPSLDRGPDTGPEAGPDGRGAGAPARPVAALRPGLRRVWRAPGRLQVGVDPALGAVLDGLDADDELLLAALESPAPGSDVHAVARRAGIAPERVDRLLAVLRAAGLLLPPRGLGAAVARPAATSPAGTLPAAALARWRPDAETLAVAHPGGDGWAVLTERRRRSVVVAGAGRTGVRVAVALAASAVGTVLVEDEARVVAADTAPGGYREHDVGRLRADAAADVLVEHAPHTRTAAPGLQRPDLVVLVGRDAVDPGAAALLVAGDVPHLAIVLRERDAAVGPLVVPGDGPCLRCLDLHRRDRDPEWPRVLPQLARPARRPPGEEASLSALAAALATSQALAWLDRDVPAGAAAASTREPDVGPVTRGATLEVSLPDGGIALRPWSAHAECGCTWPPRRRPGPSERATTDQRRQ